MDAPLAVAGRSHLSAMNPKAGSFNIPDQLQWHYGVFACNMPEKPDLRSGLRLQSGPVRINLNHGMMCN